MGKDSDLLRKVKGFDDDGFKVIKKDKGAGGAIVQPVGSDRTYLMVETQTNTEKSARKTVEKLRRELELRNELGHNQHLVDYTVTKDSGLCSTTYTIRAFYENIPDS